MIIAEDTPSAKDWCFIIGWGRTGTTIMAEIISAHSKAKIFSEAWLWGYVDLLTIPTLEICTPQSPMYRQMEYYQAEMPSNVGTKMDNFVLADNQPYTYNNETLIKENCWGSNQIRTIMDGFKLALPPSKCTMFGDKHWYYRYILEDLLKVFPECKLILTTRNKWDLAASSFDSSAFSARRSDLSREELAAVALERANQQCVDDNHLKNSGLNIYTVAFEDMAQNAEKTIKSTLEYLELKEQGEFNWNILNKIHYGEAMGHWEKIPELVALR